MMHRDCEQAEAEKAKKAAQAKAKGADVAKGGGGEGDEGTGEKSPAKKGRSLLPAAAKPGFGMGSELAGKLAKRAEKAAGGWTGGGGGGAKGGGPGSLQKGVSGEESLSAVYESAVQGLPKRGSRANLVDQLDKGMGDGTLMLERRFLSFKRRGRPAKEGRLRPCDPHARAGCIPSRCLAQVYGLAP